MRGMMRLAIMGVPGARGGAAESPLLTGLIEFYNLDEPSGDRVGAHQGVVWQQDRSVAADEGLIGLAARTLTGTGYLRSGDRPETEDERLNIPGDGSFTITYWMKILSQTGQPGVTLEIDGSHQHYFVVYDWTEGMRSRVLFTDETDLYTWVSPAPYIPPVGVWQFYRFWWDHTKQQSFIKINESVLTSSAVVSGKTVKTGINGMRSTLVKTGDALLDMVGVWARVLTDDEGEMLYNGGSGNAYPF